MTHKRLHSVFGFVISSWLILLLLSISIGLAAAVATEHKRSNSVGVLETYHNPNTYLFALPIDGQILDGRFMNIRFKPYAAAALYDETVLFCGDVTEQFDGKTGPLIITYRTQASGMYQGVGCHELISAFQVSVPTGVQ